MRFRQHFVAFSEYILKFRAYFNFKLYDSFAMQFGDTWFIHINCLEFDEILQNFWLCGLSNINSVLVGIYFLLISRYLQKSRKQCFFSIWAFFQKIEKASTPNSIQRSLVKEWKWKCHQLFLHSSPLVQTTRAVQMAGFLILMMKFLILLQILRIS